MRTVRHLPIAGPTLQPGSSGRTGGGISAVSRGFDGDLEVNQRASTDADASLDDLSELGGIAADGEKLFLVGDIAKATGKTVRAIHHYEEIGLLRPHARSKGRYRLYDQAALARIRWIIKLHDLGMSLAQIQQMVAAWEQAPSATGAMAKIRDVYLQKLEETRAQIARLNALERELVASIDYLDTCDTCDPAELVRACTHCNVHDRSRQEEPELVAGIYGGNGHGRHGASRG